MSLSISNDISYNYETDFRVLTIGDPHFKVSNIPQSEEMTAKIIEKALEIKPDIIVCLGDILDRHENIHVVPLTLSINFLRDLEKIAPLYVIIGNHDRPNNSDFMSGQHPFNALKLWKNTTVVDHVIKKTLKNKYQFIFVPYVYPGRFIEAIYHLSPSDHYDQYQECTALFAHQEFFGAKMGAIISQQGDKWPHRHPLVISGHIHDYGRPQHNIIYTGTPMQHAFGDQNNKTISEFIFYPSSKPGKIMKPSELNSDIITESNDKSEPLNNINSINNANSDNTNSLNNEVENPINRHMEDNTGNNESDPYDGTNVEGKDWIERRIDLVLTKRIICYINASQVTTWRPPEGKLVKLVIQGTSAEIKSILKLQYLNQLKKEVISISYKTNDNNDDQHPEAITDTSPNLPYLKQLEQKSSSPGMKYWFERIFGTCDPITSESAISTSSSGGVKIMSSTKNSTNNPITSRNDPHIEII